MYSSHHTHCSYGLCTVDTESDGVFFVKFPHPWKENEKCRRWVKACGRAGFTNRAVTGRTVICSRHFVGGKGPTDAHPDPVPGQLMVLEVSGSV